MGLMTVSFASGTADLGFYTAATERLRITSGGNLQLTSDGTTRVISGNSNGGAIGIRSNSSTTDRGLLFGGIDNLFAFTEQARLDTNTGNFGIGTNAPSHPLDVNGIIRSDSWIGRANAAAPTADCAVFRPADNTLGFSTANTERMRITAAGDLLVGATSGNDGQIKVDGTGNASNCAVWGKSDGGSAAPTYVAWNNATSGDNKFIDFYTETSATVRGGIDYNRAGGLVRYNTTSDYRAKDIIGPVTNSGAIIDALTVYEGKMKGATQPRPMLIAHEAQLVAPYAVTGEKDEVNQDGTPKYQQIDVSSLVPLLIREIQSLRARVQELENKS